MPISFLLVPYGVGVFLWLIFSLLIMGHLIKYGSNHATKITLLVTYLAGAACIFFVTFYFASSITWNDALFSFQIL